MLSVNIPVYNFDVRKLVKQLCLQAGQLNIAFEIRVYDDCSDNLWKEKNRDVTRHRNVVYTELDRNTGRSAIRNKMGADSKYKYLLFIDADSELVAGDYLKKYIENVKENRVICGGTTYKKTPPGDKNKLLRWVYGTKREAVSAKIRNSKKGFIITSNNFLIEKKVFEKIHFREELKTYGHEDTLLGYDLFRNGTEIFHIDNPVEHTGLEDSAVFLEKTKTALSNLYKIEKTLLAGDIIFSKQVNFLNRFGKISKFIPLSVLRFFYNKFHRLAEKNLLGKAPSIFLFDLYKTGYFATLQN